MLLRLNLLGSNCAEKSRALVIIMADGLQFLKVYIAS